MQVELLEWMQKEFEKNSSFLKRIDLPTLFKYDEEMFALILSMPGPKRFPFLLFLAPSEKEYDKHYQDAAKYKTTWENYLIANERYWYGCKESFLEIAKIIRADGARQYTLALKFLGSHIARNGELYEQDESIQEMEVIAEAKGYDQACVVRNFLEEGGRALDIEFLKCIANAKGKAQAKSAMDAVNVFGRRYEKEIVLVFLSLITDSNSSIQEVKWNEFPLFCSCQDLINFIQAFGHIDEKMASSVWELVKTLRINALDGGLISRYTQALAHKSSENIKISLEVAKNAYRHMGVSEKVLKMATAVVKARSTFACQESAKIAQIPALLQEENPEEYVSMIAGASEEEGACLGAGLLTLLLKMKEDAYPSLDLSKYKLLLQKTTDGSFTGTLKNYLEEKKDYETDAQKYMRAQNLEEFTHLVSKVKEHNLKVKQLLYKKESIRN